MQLSYLAIFIESLDMDAYSDEFILALHKEVMDQVEWFNDNARIVTETKVITREETETYIDWDL